MRLFSDLQTLCHCWIQNFFWRWSHLVVTTSWEISYFRFTKKGLLCSLFKLKDGFYVHSIAEILFVFLGIDVQKTSVYLSKHFWKTSTFARIESVKGINAIAYKLRKICIYNEGFWTFVWYLPPVFIFQGQGHLTISKPLKGSW